MDLGWIRIYRQLTESEIWKIHPFSKGQAWIDLLVLTNHKPGVVTTKNGQIVRVERGECGWSAVALAKRWGWSRGKVTRFFSYLSEAKMVQQKTIANHTLIVICNYEHFQGDTINSTINSAINGQQTDSKQVTNKNDKNDKNNNIDISLRSISSPKRSYRITFGYDTDERIHGIVQKDLDDWREFYPALDIETELRAASAWLKGNREKRKYNVLRFLTGWFKRAQDAAGSGQRNPASDASALAELEEMKQLCSN